MSIEDEFDILHNLINVKRGGKASTAMILNKLQDIRNAEATFKTIYGDVGSTIAETSYDELYIVGGDNVATTITEIAGVKTLTISIGYFMEYKGTHSAATAAYPTSPEKGDVWIASVAGMILGTYYNIGDWMVYNGATWDKMEGNITLENDPAPKLSANLDANSKKIINLGIPTLATDAATRDYVDTKVGVGGHAHDTDTLQIDGINSNGGAFTFITSGQVSFGQNVSVPNLITAGNVDGVDVSALNILVAAISITNMPTAVNNWKMYCTNGTGIMTEIATGAANTILTGNGVAVAPSFQAIPAGGLNNIVEDLTPQLGGDLDCQEKDIDNIKDIDNNIFYCSTEAGINAAIAAIGAGGGTIILESGTIALAATITINIAGSVIIQGQGDLSILDCNGDRTAISVTGAKSCVLRDFKIDASDITTEAKEIINIDEAVDNKVVINNVSIIGDADKNGYGIELNSKNCIVRDCYIYQVNQGIYIFGSSNITIMGNTCNSNNENGIFLGNSSNNTITGNIFNSNNNHGISLAGSSNNTITGNTCNSNTGYGIGLSNSSNNTIMGNTCNSNINRGINLSNSSNNTITGNIFNSNTIRGISLNTSSNNTITGNTCNSNNINSAVSGSGIYIDNNSDYNTISGNTCNGNANAGAGTGYGIWVVSVDCDDNTIMANTALNNDTNFTDTGTNTHKQTAAGDAYNNIV